MSSASIGEFPAAGSLAWPFSYAGCVLEFCLEVVSDRVVLAILFFVLGMLTLLLLEALLVLVHLRESAQPPPTIPHSVIKMPEVLRDRIELESLGQKEDCVWLNFLTHFLFAELRDSITLRRFLTKKIQKEFEEVLTSRTGVFMDELFLRDYNLGEKFPVFTGTSVDKCDVKDDIIETLDLRTCIIYDGGFQICIDAALPFRRTAYISVKLLKLKGFLRLRFTSVPFSHWCFSFYEEPEIDLDVSAQLDGRPVMKLKNIISNQIRKIIRKKHMLPMYKIRYKPFFHPVEDPLPSMPENLQISGVPVASGVLEVTLTGASNLPIINKGAQLYCTLSTDPLPWKQMMTQSRLKKPIITKELVKHATDVSLGLTLNDDLVSDRLYPVVIVGQVLIGSPAHMANVKQGDILVSVNGTKVSSAKQATKILKSVRDKISIQVEGSTEVDGVKTSRSDVNAGIESLARESSKESNFEVLDDDDIDEEDNTVSAPIDMADNQTSRVRKTKLKPSCQSAAWDQKFIFAVDPSMAYLNICVWSHGGDRSSRNDIIGSSSHDVLVGHLNLNLDDIYLHCLLTLSGKLYDKVKLKHGHHQTEAELAKEWSSHKGWNPELMYGDLTLAFHYMPSLLSDKQRHDLASANSQMDRTPELRKGLDVKSSPARTNQSEASAASGSDSSNYTQGHHQFDSTSFITATFCDYCGKKIWMKEAFKCRTCSMVCHKKCLVKCLVNTFCTEEGARKRTALDEMWQPLASSNRGRHPDTTDGQDGNVSDKDSNRDSSQGTRSNSLAENGQTTTEESRSPSRFRNLKDRTERIKDNVVRSIKKTKTPMTLNENMILEAKEVGAQLFLDLEPTQRRDKLDELITQLDEQLKLEMKCKEELEQELESCISVEPSSSMQRRKSDVRALEGKINKSTDKLNAMRLLMLQYCTALQVCMKDPDTDLMGDIEKMEMSPQPPSSPQNSRVSYMGGFVKRASSSVKEKMSSIRKDFGKKGSPKISPKHTNVESFKTKQEEGLKNNSRMFSSILGGFSSKTDRNQPQSDEREFGDANDPLLQPDDHSTKSIKIPEPNHTRSRSLVNEALLRGENLPLPGSLPTKLSLPKIEINDHNTDQIEGQDRENKESEPISAASAKLSRSSSDSHLEINKMVTLNPDDILQYHGNSLPKVFVSEDEESDDYFILDSSDDDDDDENAILDFSDLGRKSLHSSYRQSVIEDGGSEIVVTPEDIIRGSIKYRSAADGTHSTTNGQEKTGLNGALDRINDEIDDDSDNDRQDENNQSENRHSYIV